MKQYKADKQARLNQIEQIEQYQTLVLNGSSDITTFTRSIAALPVKDDCNVSSQYIAHIKSIPLARS